MQQRFIYMIEWDLSTATCAVAILVLSTCILRMNLSWQIAAVVSFIKVSICVAYFLFFADGQWFYGGDDHKYLERGFDLYRTGANPIMVFFEPVAEWHLFGGRSNTAFMSYFNYLAMYFFGPRYHAPVMSLVVVGSATAVLLAKAADQFGSVEYQKGLTVFVALHWHTIVWTSFLNLKDPVVALFAALGIFAISRIKRNPLLGISLFALTVATFKYVRFYFPIFLIPPLVLTNIITNSLRIRLVLLILGVALAGIVLRNEMMMALGLVNLKGIMYGAAHFLLQPAPWKLTEPATYLLIPSILHWLMIPVACVGALSLIKEGPEGRMIIWIVVLGTLFYAAFPLIASTRHRAPFDFLIALIQFHGLWFIAAQIVGWKTGFYRFRT